MMFASKEASSETFGKAALVWIFMAYLFHTIGELCASPVSLSFITKLAPIKYASIMMGIYFAATGFGNKLAGAIGESSQLESYKGNFIASVETMNSLTKMEEIKIGKDKIIQDYPMNQDQNIEFKTNIYLDGELIVCEKLDDGNNLTSLFELNAESKEKLKEELKAYDSSPENVYHAKILFEKDGEAVKLEENKGDGKDYSLSFIIEETQNAQEYKTFMWISIFTVVFGLLLIIFLKKLKALTHGAEDGERQIHDEAEGFELADQ